MQEKYTAEALEAQRQYLREWRKKHPEKVREYNRTFWERKAARQREVEKNDAVSEDS